MTAAKDEESELSAAMGKASIGGGKKKEETQEIDPFPIESDNWCANPTCHRQPESAKDLTKVFAPSSACACCGREASESEKEVKLSACAKCHTARYCSRECQVNHWKEKGGHKEMCRTIQDYKKHLKEEAKFLPEGRVLMYCSACEMAKYCSAECQRAHFSEHRTECTFLGGFKSSGLFERPPPPSDCDICFETLPIRAEELSFLTCCGKTICNGCYYANIVALREHNDALALRSVRRGSPLPPSSPQYRKETCAFCRTGMPANDDEIIERMQSRIDDFNDPNAMRELGYWYEEGAHGLKRNPKKARNLLNKAAELGDGPAHSCLSTWYQEGRAGLPVDMDKAFHHITEAVGAGQIHARNTMGYLIAMERGCVITSSKVWQTCSAFGCESSLRNLATMAFKDKTIPVSTYCRAHMVHTQYVKRHSSKERDAAKKANACGAWM